MHTDHQCSLMDNSSSCSCGSQQSTLSQTLDEMDFERGIWQAALDGNTERVLTLIQKQNIHPNITDSNGFTALHYAARNGKSDVVKVLLEHGACINCRTRGNGATPLHRASVAGHIDTVKILLSKGADPNLKDFDGKNALDKAKQGEHHELIQLLTNLTK